MQRLARVRVHLWPMSDWCGGWLQAIGQREQPARHAHAQTKWLLWQICHNLSSLRFAQKLVLVFVANHPGGVWIKQHGKVLIALQNVSLSAIRELACSQLRSAPIPKNGQLQTERRLKSAECAVDAGHQHINLLGGDD